MKPVPKHLVEAAEALPSDQYAVHESDEVKQKALQLARGRYQRWLIQGVAALSHATLRGRAAQYPNSYRDSADNLLRRLRNAGLGDEYRTKRGKRVLVIYDFNGNV